MATNRSGACTWRWWAVISLLARLRIRDSRRRGFHLAKSNFSHNTGDACVDVIDQHSYRQPPEEVARLVESLRAKDIWALRAAYRSQIADNPTYLLAMDMGGQVHRLGRLHRSSSCLDHPSR